MPPDATVARALEAARAQAGLSQDELWALYWHRGGESKRATVVSYLRGQTEPQVSQYNILATVLNSQLEKSGVEPWLPVIEFPPASGDGAGT